MDFRFKEVNLDLYPERVMGQCQSDSTNAEVGEAKKREMKQRAVLKEKKIAEGLAGK